MGSVQSCEKGSREWCQGLLMANLHLSGLMPLCKRVIYFSCSLKNHLCAFVAAKCAAHFKVFFPALGGMDLI